LVFRTKTICTASAPNMRSRRLDIAVRAIGSMDPSSGGEPPLDNNASEQL
jgi:hypothetical protein